MGHGFRNLLAVPVSALAMATATAAAAQPAADAAAGEAAQADQPPVAQAQAEQPSIVITGTRIRQVGMESPTPVTSLTSGDISNIAPSGVVDALDRLPSFLNSANASTDSSSGVSDAGGTNLNLRGLGTQRTLTLLNSRRVVPNNKEGTVNIDIFPSLLIQRLDIVTGGASAAYGTDAVAGVVNFLLDTNFEGFRGNVQGGITGRGDNANGKIELAYGDRIGDRFSFVVAADYGRAEGLQGWEGRDWQQGGSLMTNPNRAAGGPTFITVLDTVGTSFTCGGLIASPNAAINRLEFLPDGTVQRFVNSPVSVNGAGTNNAQSLASGGGSGCDPARTRAIGAGPSVSPDREQAHLYGYADFEVTPNVTLFLEGLWSHDWSNLGASAATMVAPWNATIFVDNAYLPAQVRDAMVAAGTQSFNFQRFLNPIFTESNTFLRNRTVQVTGGVEADLATGGFLDGWHVQAYGSYGRNQQRVQFYGKEQISTIYIALDAVRDANGNIVCRASLFNPAYRDCVPLNLFGEGNASQAAIDYVTTPLQGEADAITFFYILKQWNMEASMSGEIWSGWGAGPITAAFGASYRDQSLTSFQTGLGEMFDTPTNAVPGVRGIPASIAGDPDVHLFDSFADVEGSFNVKEAFAELNIPIVRERPFLRDVSLNGAVRWADYSGSGTIWSYKVGLDWQVTNDFRLRGTYSRDVRAATLSERFDIQQTNGSVTNDPVTGQTYNFSQTTGGNPNVNPEKADTFTVGAVLRPSWFPGFDMSVDYFSVSISDAIGQLGTQNIVEQCFDGATELCDLITRDPTTQLITGLRNIFINIAEEKAEGLDVELAYVTRLSLLGGGEERLRLRALGSFLFERSLQLPGAPALVLDGQLATTSAGDYFSYPNFQSTANLNYINGPFSLLLQGRYIDGGRLNNTYVEGVDVDDNHVPGVFYFDVGLNYKIIDTATRDVELYAFVTNLFDRDPPLAPQPFAALGGSVQTNLQLYDFLGQRFLVGARFEF